MGSTICDCRKHHFFTPGFQFNTTGDGRNVGALNRYIHQKPLPIRGDGVLLSLRARRDFDKMGRKQPDRRANLQRLATGCRFNGDRHQLAVGRDIEEFLTITVPSRVCSTGIGNLQFGSGTRERLYIDLILTGLVGL